MPAPRSDNLPTGSLARWNTSAISTEYVSDEPHEAV